ncbi:hypothetical protein Tco_1410584 [Tanacetum coccineum]
MSPAVKETPNVDGSVRNIVNMEEEVSWDFPTKNAHNEKLKYVRNRLTYREDTEHNLESASRHRKRKKKGGKQKEIQKYHPRPGPKVCSPAWGQKKEEDEGEDLHHKHLHDPQACSPV